MTSIAFRNVEVFDGLGGESFITDVGVKSGRIDRIGQVPTAQIEIEGEGYVLSPGFIDTHAHDDGAFIRHPGKWRNSGRTKRGFCRLGGLLCDGS